MTVQSVLIELLNGRIHTFHLGHGSCGREVTELNVFTENGVFEVEQTCTDNHDPDYFGYPLTNVARYKVCHTDNPNPARNKQ